MNKIYKHFQSLFLIFSLMLTINLKAQYIDISRDEFPNFSIGPGNMTSLGSAVSRHAYIYPEALVKDFKHGDSIQSLDFLRLINGSLTGVVNMKIYMRTTLNTTYPNRNINWVNQLGVTGMTKVYDNDPTTEVGSNAGWSNFKLTKPYVIDTVLGKNFEILIAYQHSSTQSQVITWASEFAGFSANQTKYVTSVSGTITDTTTSFTAYHPSIRIHFPRYKNDARVEMVYSLGKLPIPLGNPDSVKAIVRNVGKNNLTNFKFYIESKGKNKHKDSINVNLLRGEEKLIIMPSYSPTNLGLDTLIVSVAKDDTIFNNSARSFRQCTENIYSYKDPTRPILGGIGFNGQTGDFVAKFYSNAVKAINQINVSFSGSNTRFKLGIWQADGKNGSPKTNIWTSDTLVSAPNFTTPVLPPISVNGPFFVGVRQIGTTNVAFGYQAEDPVRSSTFYYTAPSGDTNWVDFAPDAPFKFAIEPRIQTNNDVSPISYDFPKDTISLIGIKTMAPKATILNYGALNQTTPFNVSMIIRRNNSVEYTSTKSDTLSSGRKRRIIFDSTFLPTQSGDYDVQIITRLVSDQMKDNDTLRRKFVVASYKDVGMGVVFDPSNNTEYEEFIDTIYPTVYVQNFGLDRQGPFNVTAEIYDSTNTKVYSEVQSATLTANNSVIKVFKEFPCNKKGKYIFKAFTSLGIDVQRNNDTAVRYFSVVRSNDVSITTCYYPLNGSSLVPPVANKRPSVELENLGLLNQGVDFNVYCKIYFNNNLVYTDSVVTTSFRNASSTLSFKFFKPIQKGYYTMKAFSDLPEDQYRANDTFTSGFAVGVPDDVQPLSVTPLLTNSGLIINAKYAPKVLVKNNGFNNQNTPFPIVFKVTKGAQTVYLDIKLTTLDSGDSKLITFDSTLMLKDTSRVNVLVYTILNADFFKKNDTLKGFYFGKKLYDVGVAAIQYPVITDTLLVNKTGISPTVTIQNLGDSIVRSKFRTVCRIINKNTSAVIYQNTIDTTLTGNSPLNLIFPAIAKQMLSMPISVIAYTTYIGDQDLRNDTAKSFSQYELWYDVQPIEIKLPVNAKTYDIANTPIYPRVICRNNGSKTIGIIIAKMEIKKVVNNIETSVYSSTQKILLLSKGETDTVTFATPFNFSTQTLGNYKTYLTLFNSLGESDANDTLQNSFTINDKTGVNAIILSQIKIYPNPAKDFVMVDISQLSQLPISFKVYSIDGKLILEKPLSDTRSKILTTDWTNGTYIIEIESFKVKIIVLH